MKPPIFFLTPLSSPPLQSRIVVWDIETTIDGMDPFICGVRWGAGENDFRQFTGKRCMSRFLDWLLEDTKKGEDTFYFAHNGGGFDHLFLIYEMVERQPGRFKVCPVLSGSSAILVMVEDKETSRKFMLVDSLRLLNMSLKKIGKAMGGEQKQEFDIHTDPSDPRWLEYNNQDTVVLWDAISKLQSALNSLGGQMRVTAASSSMDLFRRVYLKRRLPKIPDRIESLVRRAYFGGRVERFDTRRRFDVKLYDINSLYPYSCTFPLPTEYLERIERPDPRKITLERLEREHSHGFSYFVKCFVEVPDTLKAGPLPVRRDKPKGLFYPTGRFGGLWNSYDLLNLYRAGGHVVYLDWMLQFACEPIAQQMMQDLYNQRLNKDRPEMGLAAKLLMNSWYGKTGQRSERDLMFFSPSPEDMENGEWVCEDPETDLWTSVTIKHEPHILPHIAAQVTAIARSVHYPYLLASSDPIYCDTDCIVQSEVMTTSPDIGRMKLEESYRWFQSYLPKLYHGQTEGGEIKSKAKGFGGWNKEEYEGGVVSHLVSGGSVRVRGPAKLRTLQAGKSLKPREKVLDKSIRSSYDKRIVLPDGTTKPIKLTEG